MKGKEAKRLTRCTENRCSRGYIYFVGRKEEKILFIKSARWDIEGGAVCGKNGEGDRN